MGKLGLGFGLGLGQSQLSANWANWTAELTAAQKLNIDFAGLDLTFQSVAGQTPADDAGEAIALALDSAAWGGRTLAATVAAQPDLRNTATLGSVGTVTPATFDTATGAGAVTRVDSSNQSYVILPMTVGQAYEIDVICSFNTGIIGRQGSAVAANLFSFPNVRTKFRFIATATTLYLVSSVVGTPTFTVYAFKAIPGNPADQGTVAAQPSRQAGGVSRYDGSADNLLTTFRAQSGAMTLLYKGTVPATLAAVQTIMGSSGSSANRCWLGVNTSGFICAGVGSQTESTIVGTKDVRGKTIVAALTFTGSAVTLFLLVDGVVTQEYTGAQASTPTTTIPFRVGALNNNGTAGSFAAIDGNSFRAAYKAMTLTDFAQIATKL